MAYTKATKQGLIPSAGAITTKEQAKVPSFDLSNINVVELANTLSAHITRPQSAGWLSRWWQDRKLPKDNARLMQLQVYVDNLIKINDSITDMQHKLFIQPQVLNHMISGNLLRMRQEMELQIRQHQDNMDRLDDENEMRKAQVAKVKAEAAQLEANAILTQLQGTLLRRIIDELDLSNITPQQAFVLVKALNPLAGKDIDLASQQLLIEGQLEKYKAEAEMIRAQAKQEETEAQHRAWKFKQDKKPPK
jgi:hypothetical protein